MTPPAPRLSAVETTVLGSARSGTVSAPTVRGLLEPGFLDVQLPIGAVAFEGIIEHWVSRATVEGDDSGANA